ncbi:MAG: nucleotide exchange factor GrpE [Treponema sp.]
MTKKHKKEHSTAPEEQNSEAAGSAGDENGTGTPAQGTAAESGACTTPDFEAEKAAPAEEDKLSALEARCKELQDQYLRKAADFDNYRKRMIREKQEAIAYANTNLLLDLLQVLDDFDRAIEAGGVPEEGSQAAAFTQGVLMIRNGMASLLESKYDLHYYESVDQVFDPAIHEAVSTAVSKEVKEPTVGAELQKGYKLKDRVLRPAKVMVYMPEAETPDAATQA